VQLESTQITIKETTPIENLSCVSSYFWPIQIWKGSGTNYVFIFWYHLLFAQWGAL